MSLTIFSTSRRLAGKTEINKDNNKDDNNIVVNNKHERKEENKNVSNQDKQTIPNTSTNTHAQANIYRTLSHHQTMRSFPEAGYSGEGIPDGLFHSPQTHRHQQLIWEQTSTKSIHPQTLLLTHSPKKPNDVRNYFILKEQRNTMRERVRQRWREFCGGTGNGERQFAELNGCSRRVYECKCDSESVVWVIYIWIYDS